MTEGVSQSSLAPMYEGVMEKVHLRVKRPGLLHKPEYEALKESLEEEMYHDYQFSIRRAIGT